MLTQVTLYGPLAEKFGRDWELDVSSPGEAMRMINANRPGFFNWVRGNLDKYDRYKVIVDYHDGRKEHLDEETIKLERKVKRIRIVPIVTGAGAIGKMILGFVIFSFGLVLSATPFGLPLMGMGMAMFIGGVVQAISPKPRKGDQNVKQDGTSYFFDGPVNTTHEGVPVALIYGKGVLVGSHPISAKVTVDQLL